MLERINQQLAFLIEIDKMKTILRQTLLMDGSRQENDAEHSWHFATMALVLYEYAFSDKVDLNRVIKMALIHDLVEIYAGDTFAYDVEANRGKEEREEQAAEKLFSILPSDQGKEYRLLWEEFDKMESPDSIYASAIDRLQPFLSNAQTGGHTWKKGRVTKDQVYDRMAMVKKGTPKLWEFVETTIEKAVAEGLIHP